MSALRRVSHCVTALGSFTPLVPSLEMVQSSLSHASPAQRPEAGPNPPCQPHLLWSWDGPVSHSRTALLLPLPQSLPGSCLTSALPALSSQLDGPAPPTSCPYLGSPSMGFLAHSAVRLSALGPLHLLPGGVCELDTWALLCLS